MVVGIILKLYVFNCLSSKDLSMLFLKLWMGNKYIIFLHSSNIDIHCAIHLVYEVLMIKLFTYIWSLY